VRLRHSLYLNCAGPLHCSNRKMKVNKYRKVQGGDTQCANNKPITPPHHPHKTTCSCSRRSTAPANPTALPPSFSAPTKMIYVTTAITRICPTASHARLAAQELSGRPGSCRASGRQRPTPSAIMAPGGHVLRTDPDGRVGVECSSRLPQRRPIQN